MTSLLSRPLSNRFSRGYPRQLQSHPVGDRELGGGCREEQVERGGHDVRACASVCRLSTTNLPGLCSRCGGSVMLSGWWNWGRASIAVLLVAGNRPKGMIESEVDPRAAARAQELLDDFLANRNDRTLQAYTIDIEEFARFQALTPAAAIARLLASGPSAARRVVLEYAVDLRRKGRAQATIDRRLCTLRALV